MITIKVKCTQNLSIYQAPIEKICNLFFDYNTKFEYLSFGIKLDKDRCSNFSNYKIIGQIPYLWNLYPIYLQTNIHFRQFVPIWIN